MPYVHAVSTDDWPARSNALRALGELQPASPDPATIRARDIFGFEAILRPTWIAVARSQRSMSTGASWFAFKWARLSRQMDPYRYSQRFTFAHNARNRLA